MPFPGKIVKEFPPSSLNSRNSEGDFIQMDDGRIALVYTRFRSNNHDGGTADLAVSFSIDGGESFSPEKIILSPEDVGAINIMSVSLFKDNAGNICLFYLKKYYGMQCKAFLRRTRDLITFSEEICCFEEEGYYTVNNQRVIRLQNGNLLIPASFTDTSLYQLTDKNKAHDYQDFPWPPGRGVIYLSEDDGYTWKRIAVIEPPFGNMKAGCDNGLQEPGMVVLDDGCVYLYFRNTTGRQLQAYSYDGGYTWSALTPSRFTSPPSPMSTLRLSSGEIMVGYNPVPHFYERSQGKRYWTGGRTPYVLERTDGNLNPITPPRAIESDPYAGFCYCAFFETQDALLLAYCAGGEYDQGGCLTRLRVRKIMKEDL